ncbi:HAD family hydrolase [Microbacterium azadirachtae]|uniref:(S)-2-haloacid dehalogenase 4A n=1 Tax=Microbacterium azadirachtae TaxID=582680 RepID=A0A0F0LLD1_9MICO|nr:HAD family hydrolase [Microbacterium azadirachtae]KJL32326.1 (S)-2-haloacid dehalogenase 4A [Microbacterium azadirachtae]
MFSRRLLRAAIFDLDGTLLDQRGAQDAAAVAFAAEHGIHDDGVIERWDAIAERHYRRYQRREIDFEDQRRDRARDFLERDLTDEDASTIFARYGTRYAAGLRRFDDALPVLSRAKEAGLIVGLLTNGDRAQQQGKLDRFEFGPHLDVVVCSSDLAAGKPDSRAFAAALDRLGVSASEAVMIGDSLETDVRGALAAGLQAVHLARTGARDPDVVSVGSLDELVFAD